jgi:hypothetical protein
MATWPTLPAPIINSYSETLPDNVIRTSMDKGPAKVRRRTTANTAAMQYAMVLTAAQVATLSTFYTTTTLSGAQEFDYTHPRTGATVTARFTAPPTYSDINGRAYRVEVALEILP